MPTVNLFKAIAQDELISHSSKENAMIKHRLKVGEFATFVYGFTFVTVFLLMSIYTAIQEVSVLHTSPPETVDGSEDKTLLAPTYDLFKRVTAERGGTPPVCPCTVTNPPLLGVDSAGESTFVTPVVEVNSLCATANIDTRVTACANTSNAPACPTLKPIFNAVKALCTTATTKSNAAKARAMKARIASPVAMTQKELTLRVKEIFDDVREQEVISFTTPWNTIKQYSRLERPLTSVTTGYDVYSPWDIDHANNGGQLPEPGKHYVPSNGQDLGEVNFLVSYGTASQLNTQTCNCFTDFKCKKEETVVPAAANNGKPFKVTVYCSSTDTMFDINIELFTDASLAAKVLGLPDASSLGGRRMAEEQTTKRRELQGSYGPGSYSGSYPSYGGGDYFDEGPPQETSYTFQGGSKYDSGSFCNDGCPAEWIGDGICDQSCNVAACDFDTDPTSGVADCGSKFSYGESATGSMLPPCYPFCQYAAYGGLETYSFESETGVVDGEYVVETASSFEDKGAKKGPLSAAVNQGMLSKFGSIVDHKKYFEKVCKPKKCEWITRQRPSSASVVSTIFGLLGGVAIVVKTFSTTIATLYDMQMKQRNVMFSGEGFKTIKREDPSTSVENPMAKTAAAVP